MRLYAWWCVFPVAKTDSRCFQELALLPTVIVLHVIHYFYLLFKAILLSALWAAPYDTSVAKKWSFHLVWYAAGAFDIVFTFILCCKFGMYLLLNVKWSVRGRLYGTKLAVCAFRKTVLYLAQPNIISSPNAELHTMMQVPVTNTSLTVCMHKHPLRTN